jgi:hypothetical protein
MLDLLQQLLIILVLALIACVLVAALWHLAPSATTRVLVRSRRVAAALMKWLLLLSAMIGVLLVIAWLQPWLRPWLDAWGRVALGVAVVALTALFAWATFAERASAGQHGRELQKLFEQMSPEERREYDKVKDWPPEELLAWRDGRKKT